MVSPMAILMLLMMPMMYKDKKRNLVILLSALAVFSGSLIMLRTQTAVTDSQYIRAMVPHHSSAIMTSKNVDLKDPELKALSSSIITSQQREIAQMEAILLRLHKENSEMQKTAH